MSVTGLGVVEHGTRLHSSSWNLSPTQSAPPFEGDGSVQYLSREVSEDFLQSFGQVDQAVHSVNPPLIVSLSTEKISLHKPQHQHYQQQPLNPCLTT